MGRVKIWVPLALASFTWLITAVVALNASVSWSALFIRSFCAASVVGGLTCVTLFYFDKVLTQSDNHRNITRSHFGNEAHKGSMVDVKVPAANPFVPGQIEADIEELLASDPTRAAEIMRKMQLES
ncbi:hypothetical protein H1S01_02790 [Heliobacterium chlorum]|uniref:Uncharacterized protein n=1 Tax=Heliobacterium chlorum TaxID=2698 RepID=A0ABR7SY49_HELCL|nr:hypothetical protein [Heliobacterium chlorum]MBC9783439.1 hypothetical protein [Heliobacterium chlorum]